MLCDSNSSVKRIEPTFISTQNLFLISCFIFSGGGGHEKNTLFVAKIHTTPHGHEKESGDNLNAMQKYYDCHLHVLSI